MKAYQAQDEEDPTLPEEPEGQEEEAEREELENEEDDNDKEMTAPFAMLVFDESTNVYDIINLTFTETEN